MAGHSVRIQLEDVDEGDDAYQTLHDEMEERGFKRFIKGGSGKKYALPTGSYNFDDDAVSTDDVLERAKKAAKATGHAAKILVTTGTRKWVGLDQTDD